MDVKSKVWLAKDDKLVFGAGKAQILRAVQKTGSLNGAAKELNMSYRHLWSAINAAEKRLGRKLLVKARGGRDGGGAMLTEFAEELTSRFEKINKETEAYASKRYKAVFRDLMIIILCLTMSYASASEPTAIRLATTTSTFETGLLDHILPPFEKKHSMAVHVISCGTGKALKLGENGDVDAVLVHARTAEDAFVENGYGVNRRDVMYNDFLILGPKDDPAGISGTIAVGHALKKIMQAKSIFISRGDDSGTHKKELELWKASGSQPKGAWYLQAGQGMSATLRMADEKDAYIIVDRATYLFNRSKIRLVPHVESDPALMNPYGVIAVSPYRHNHIQYERAMLLIAWFTSPDCQKLIADFKAEGERLFYPNAETKPETSGTKD